MKMAMVSFDTRATAKRATVAILDNAVGDGTADDTDALQQAMDAAYVVEGVPDKLYRVTKPLRWTPDTILLNTRLVVDIKDRDAVFMDWTGLGDRGVYMFGCEVFSKCPQGTVLLRLDTPDKNTPQRSFLDLVRWTGAQNRKTEDDKFIEFYTFP